MNAPGNSERPLTIFFSVGEPSGDVHAANLIRQLRQRRPNLRAVGYGGPQMEKAGCQLHYELTALAVMWLLRVLINLHKFWWLVHRAEKYFRSERPDGVVLIDYPGFNWWIARKAKRAGVPVFYYTPPQIWAWASWRVKKMRRFVDHLLCSLPFEEDWFRERGCHATFVGHPFFDEVREHQLDGAFLASQQKQTSRLVTILPGSRTQEVQANLKWFLRAAAKLRHQVPDVRFALACFQEKHVEMARAILRDSGHLDLPLEIHVGRTPELIHLAECCLAVSGSVSLELLYHTKPTVIHYHVSRLAFRVQKYFRKVKYITLVNLLNTDDLFPADITPFDPRQPDAEKVLFPEYLTCEDKTQQLAEHITTWLTDPSAMARRVGDLAELKTRVAHGGASAKAADYIVDHIDRRPPLAGPHIKIKSGVRTATPQG